MPTSCHRSGIIPLDNTSDIAGPIARTVEDVARMLEVLVGVDPSDPLTGLSKFLGSAPANYTGQLSRGALKVSSPPPQHACLFLDAPAYQSAPARFAGQSLCDDQ